MNTNDFSSQILIKNITHSALEKLLNKKLSKTQSVPDNRKLRKL